MNLWLLATLGYLGVAALTFVPVASALLRRIRLHDGGDGPDESPLFSEGARTRLRQNHSRLLGTLQFWKKRAECYKRFHYYSLGWIIPSSVLMPVLTQAITQDQLHGRSCTIVLVGSKTAGRKWIDYEIVESWNAGMGVVGIHIHGLKNLVGDTATKGSNPFDNISYGDKGKKLSAIVKCYTPLGSDSKEKYAWIKKQLANAVEEALKIRNDN